MKNPFRLRCSQFVLLVLATAATAGVAPAFAQGGICKTDSRYAALDFYLGEWQLESTTGEVLGTSRITKRPDGCAMTESYRGMDGRVGETLTFLDPSDGAWRQVGVGSFGDVFQNRGRAGNGEYEFEGTLATPDGETTQLRGTLNRDGDLVRYRVERRQGSSWEVLEEGLYRPVSQVTANRGAKSSQDAEVSPGKKDRKRSREQTSKAAPSSPPTGTPQAAEAPVVAAAPSSVTVVPVPEERRVQTLSTRTADPVEIEVDSPMVLQFEIGRVENLPEGYGWATSETSQYVCRQTRIQKVNVTRRKRKGQLTLDVTADIHTKQYIGQYGLLIELLDGDEVVASAEDPQFKAGKGVPAQALDGALGKTLSLDVDQATFDRIFSDGGDRPQLRVQLTVF